MTPFLNRGAFHTHRFAAHFVPFRTYEGRKAGGGGQSCNHYPSTQDAATCRLFKSVGKGPVAGPDRAAAVQRLRVHVPGRVLRVEEDGVALAGPDLCDRDAALKRRSEPGRSERCYCKWLPHPAQEQSTVGAPVRSRRGTKETINPAAAPLCHLFECARRGWRRPCEAGPRSRRCTAMNRNPRLTGAMPILTCAMPMECCPLHSSAGSVCVQREEHGIR